MVKVMPARGFAAATIVIPSTLMSNTRTSNDCVSEYVTVATERRG